MQTFLWITGAILTALPFVIAFKRKCKNFILIDLLSFFLSWTIIGWVVAMAWAIWGNPTRRSSPNPSGADKFLARYHSVSRVPSESSPIRT